LHLSASPVGAIVAAPIASCYITGDRSPRRSTVGCSIKHVHIVAYIGLYEAIVATIAIRRDSCPGRRSSPRRSLRQSRRRSPRAYAL